MLASPDSSINDCFLPSMTSSLLAPNCLRVTKRKMDDHHSFHVNKMDSISSQIETLENELKGPQQSVSYRMRLLEESGSGLPPLFVEVMRDSVRTWLGSDSFHGSSDVSLETSDETIRLSRCLKVYKNIAETDPSLDDEIAREGSHAILSKLIKIDPFLLKRERDQDAVMEIQDFACEIAALSPSFPVRATPFTPDELRARLPLSFQISPISSDSHDEQNDFTVLINEVKTRQTAQKDVGFVMWPSSVALARWMITNPQEVKGKEVLEIGAGCGLVGLVAAKIKLSQKNSSKNDTTSVTLTDFNETVVENIKQNIRLNDVGSIAESAGLDFYEQVVSTCGWTDSNGTRREQVDLILASDIICQPDDAFAAANTIFCSLCVGGKAVVVSADSKHRFGVECFQDACTGVGLTVSRTAVSEIYEGQLLLTDMEKTSGYVQGMALTMYVVEKSIIE